MAIDINNDIKDVSTKVQNYQQYKEFKSSYKDLKKVAGGSFEENKKFIISQLDKFNKNKQKQDNTCKPFIASLIELLKKLKGSGLDTDKFVKKIYLETLKDSKKGIVELLVKLTKEFLNCGENQQYQFNTSFYIPVANVDLFGVLQKSPDDNIAKFFYEEKPQNFSSYLSNPIENPFSMNRELYNRIQNLNQPFSVQNNNNYYIGTSGENLIDITYVENYLDPITNQVVNGNFFKVDLAPRTSPPSIDVFLNDYYSSINVLEFRTFFSYLVDFATGSLSFGMNDGKSKLDVLGKIMAINKRLSCLCSDTKKEISVDGNAKVSEIDNTTDSFFELTDVELRLIEQMVSDIKLGVVEFEDCDNVKVPMNVQAVVDALDNLTYNEDTNDLNETDDALNILYPVTNQSFKPSLDVNFVEQFLNAIMATVLSPKVLLPFLVMAKATNQPVPSYVTDIEKFAKSYRNFYITFMSGLAARFTEKVFKILKKEILKLIAFLTSDIFQEKKQKIQKIILTIVALIANPINAITNFQECRSCLDELLALINLGVNSAILATKTAGVVGDEIPLPLLLASRALDGYSTNRAFLNAVQEMEELGIPVGPMPDGSPNKFVASVFALLQGQATEMSVNGKIAIGNGPFTITPVGVTLPQVTYGKFI